MKLVRNLALLSGVLAGPTRPPNAGDQALECPTECIEVTNHMEFFKGARPDFDYGDQDCDLEELHRKCQEEEENATTVAPAATDAPTPNFPDYMYDEPHVVSDGSRGDSEICSTFPDVCCPLMVAQNGIQEGVFSKKTTDLISDKAAESACLAENNYPCCVKADLCVAYPDLPHCQEEDYPDTAGMGGEGTEEPTVAPEEPTELPTEAPTAEPTKLPTEPPTEPATEPAPLPTVTEAVTEPATAKPTDEPLAETPGDENRLAIVGDVDVGTRGNGEDRLEDGEEHEAQNGTTNWWIVAGVLGGIGAVVAGIVVAKKFGQNAGGYTEAKLIVNQEEPSNPDDTAVDMQQEEQQQQLQ